MSDKTFEFFLGQFAALVAFFAFPALSYFLWKWTATNEGRPEIYYIPRYKTFRLVIRNLPRRITLSDIKARAILREKILPDSGTSVIAYSDLTLVSQNDFFLFPGNDQVLVSFRLQRRKGGKLTFILVDKFGHEHARYAIGKNHVLICDYIANVKNLFNFDIKLKKRAEVTAEKLSHLAKKTTGLREEEYFAVSRIRDAS